MNLAKALLMLWHMFAFGTAFWDFSQKRQRENQIATLIIWGIAMFLTIEA